MTPSVNGTHPSPAIFQRRLYRCVCGAWTELPVTEDRVEFTCGGCGEDKTHDPGDLT